ncbi:MAG: large-conductance mechanosensitive channel protein MscL [Flavobacteriales bacterium]|jgi:large conductance mechanosensitive channel|nr:large-conductance mechanosensitive channel protein MscL [Flavobacteriales bacterium]
MGMMKEFKEFAMRGNLIDMAVGVVMGAAFGKVVSGFVDGMVMPVIGKLTSGVDFKQMKWVIQDGVAETKDAAGNAVAAVPEVAIQYGAWITTIIDFTIVAFAVFMVIKAINAAKKKEAAAPPPGPSNEEKLLMEIRDALKK